MKGSVSAADLPLPEMKQSPNHHPQFWPRLVIRKWFNMSTKDTECGADPDEEDYVDYDSDTEEFSPSSRGSRLNDNSSEDAEVDDNDDFPRLRRRKSETFRVQYINTKDIKICVGTWNVGGKIPPDELDIDDWLDVREPADIYVVGLQEIVPLNAGSILGSEGNRPALKWENIIRESLNRIRPLKTKLKSFSDPPSPSRFKPSDDAPNMEDEIVLETDSEAEEGVHPVDEEPNDECKEWQAMGENAFTDSGAALFPSKSNLGISVECDLQRQFSSPKRLNRLNCLRAEHDADYEEASMPQPNGKLTRMLSGSERVGLCWPEPPLPLVSQKVLERPNSFKPIRSFRAYSSCKLDANAIPEDLSMLGEIDLEALMNRKRRSPYVRIVSKKMVGVFLTIWVRRTLRRHIQNVKVSTVGVGVMGYIGNKGSVSVSMSIYQTLFCFICTHLTSGEKDGDEVKRNNDVREIHRRTHFHPASSLGLPKSIIDHERIIWLGDLNYRINLSYEKTQELISKKDWSKLLERDQLVRELRKGRAFDGWSEGTLNFPPTYKYEINSEKYYGEDIKAGRRTPAWCDRILSCGKGMRQLSYRRTELRLSDHRPVTATYMADVEVFSPRKLQRALTFTDAEIENEEFVADMVPILE